MTSMNAIRVSADYKIITMTESKYQTKIIKEMESNGWFVLNLIKTNKNGIPDLLCLKQGREPKFIEVKAKNGIVSKLQEYRLKELNELGFDAMIKRCEE